MLEKIFYEEDDEKIEGKVKIKALYPKTFVEASDIGNYLKEGVGTVINISYLQGDERQRLLDFISGICMALEGKIVKVDENVIIATPRLFELENCVGIRKENI